MTVKEKAKLENKFKRKSKAFKWIRKHVSKSIGEKLIDWNDDKWSEIY